MSTQTPTERLARIRDALASHGQSHLLAFAESLELDRRERLLDQLDAIDLDDLDRLIERYVRKQENVALPGDIAPAAYYAADGSGYDADAYRQRGAELIAQGKVAAFTVAGGQGTRLGWDGPKGTFPATPVTGKPLFQLFAEQIRAAERKYDVTIPWYIMTSPINDAATRGFIADDNCFGLNRSNIFVFPQGVLPSIDAETGRLLLAREDEVAVNPDGHGGSLKALQASGALEDMQARGIELISYFQVDNPLVKVVDPLFIGLHASAPDSSGEMSSKMVVKAYPEEKVGVFATADGATRVIEYSDLPEELSRETEPDGRLRFRSGSIAIHLLGVSFVERLTSDPSGFALPYHRANKKVPYVDPSTGQLVKPADANGVKLETFVFDAIPLASASIVLETERSEEFAPIKNAKGVDSPGSSHQLQIERAARWLEQAGVEVPRREDGSVAAAIEIEPTTALDPDDLASVDLPGTISPGENVIL